MQKSTGAAITVAFLLICSTVAHLGAQAPEPLFSDERAGPALGAPAADPRPFVVRSRTTTLRAGALDRALAGPATNTFTLNLFDDATFAVTFERAEASAFGTRTWSGHITDRPLSNVSLTLNGDTVLGTVTDNNTLFEIRDIGGGVHRIDQMDTTLMPRETDVAVPGSLAPAANQGPAADVAAPAASSVNIFVYYSAALTAQLGPVGVTSLIDQQIANANSAYDRSGIAGQLHLVGKAELPAAVEGQDSGLLLDAFAATPAVQAQRNAAGADLVALLIRDFAPPEPGLISCGIAYVGSAGSTNAAFSVTSTNSACVYTFVHEVGHNLGGQHAPDDTLLDPAGSPEYPAYARGYKFQGAAPFRTVMAYDCSSGPDCPRILNFSNPAVLENGQVTGTSSQRNASRLNELFPQVAAYRAGGPVGTPPSAPVLQGSVVGNTVNLSWQPGAGGGAPTDYLISAGTAPGLSNIVAGLPFAGTNLSAPGIPVGSYHIRVHARNSGGVSGPSNEFNAVIGGCTKPSVPQNFTVTKNGNNLALSWSPPAVGGPSFLYGLMAGSSPGATNLFLGAIGSITSIGGAVPNGNYFLRVIAANGCGIGPATSEVGISIP
jgi:peptidyl-Asp metalloendopeptidase